MGYYDYYKNYCVCRPQLVVLGLGDQLCNEVDSWPAEVWNVEGSFLGIANNKSQYITMWNDNAVNNEIGVLFNFFGPFSFLLKVNPGQLIPNCLGAISTAGLMNLYALEYGVEYE